MSNGNLSGGSSTNDVRPSFGHNRNRFPLNSHEFLTARFGEITPFAVCNCEPGDTIPLSSSHDIQTYTLKSPLLSSFKMFKSYFKVPMSAILPRTWELIYTNPVQGNDVPSDALCVTSKIGDLIHNLGIVTSSETSGSLTYDLNTRVRAWLLLENILSYGGLPQLLRRNLRVFCHVSTRSSPSDAWVDTDYRKLNIVFESFYGTLYQSFVSSGINGFKILDRNLQPYYNPSSTSASEFRYMISLLRENPSLNLPTALTASVFDTFCRTHKLISSGVSEPFNFSRLAAYQLSIAEFYSNEFVDSIYSSLLYRDNLESIAIANIGSAKSFTYNGRSILYDAFSGWYFDRHVSLLVSNPSYVGIYEWFSLIFNFRRSLKRVDYFTSTKTRPLAVGSTTAPVVGSTVDAVDMTRAIQVQRFLNSVNKTGRKFSEYVRGIFGADVPKDRHEPHFISSQPFDISGFEVEQTSVGNATSTQLGSRVTVLKSSGSRFEFSVDVSEPSIILGLLHFETARAYADASDRQTYHSDRFEMFNPFMQYIGDQSLYLSELGGVPSSDFAPFSYQNRYQEYKQSFDHASGGFCNGVLPSYASVESSNDIYVGQVLPSSSLNADYIRSYSQELDRFYQSLTYYSLASYFHFIISVQNSIDSVRSMEYKPNIL